MKLHFLGANRQVTGSRYCLEVGDKKVLIDCGLFQERNFQDRNWNPSPIPEDSVDAIILTHAHIDHTGLLPRFVRNGFSGPVFSTRPTADLVDIMLRDSARIQQEDIKYKEKRHKKSGKKSKFPYDPLYTEDDALATLKMVRGVAYSTPKDVVDGVQVTFHEAGHILGSSSLELVVAADGQQKTIVFSGDIGQFGKPIIRDPSNFVSADYVVMESTYGDRDHRDGGEIDDQLCEIINDTAQRGGKVIIPTFAVERAQELMYYIGGLVHEDRIPDIPIFLDSPMAVDVTNIFYQHSDAFDSDTWERITRGVPPLRFPGLTMVRKAVDSKAINSIDGPAIIMSTSGMCHAGRIKHHLRNNIQDPNATVLFVGFQGRGTLGRLILDGRETVRIHGKEYKVRARIAQIFGFSGHADRQGLIDWIDAFESPAKKLFLTHGEEEPALALADKIKAQGWDVEVPEYQSTFELD